MTRRLVNVSGSGVDLRTRRRDQVEKMLELAQHLETRDRLLFEQVYRYGQRVSDVARVAGCDAARLRRRIHRIIKQLRSPMFRFLIQHERLLTEPVRKTARQVVLRRKTLRQTAALVDRPLHEVRQHMASLRALARHYGVRT